jgi:methylisocitrate lyase
MGAHDVLTARLLEEAGFELVFLGGFSVTASLLGLPDLDFLGMSEMAGVIRRTVRRVSIPVLADADTGYGDLHHVARCVEEFEAAGAAGLLLEDQVFPKRCGHFEGKSVIPAAQMVEKLDVALKSRSDDNLVLVARTDARAVEGIDAAIDRANRYCEAGADIAFVEAPLSREELEEIARRVSYPKLVNMLTFGKTPILNARELEDLGYKIVVAPVETLLVAAKSISRLAQSFLRDGDCQASAHEMVTFDEIKELLGLSDQLRLGG